MPKPQRQAGHPPYRWPSAIVLIALAIGFACALPVAPAAAESASEKLESVEDKLSHAEEREGVLTSEIEALGEEIAALESQVASLRRQEAAVEAELAAKQAELEHAEDQLAEAMDRLAHLRERLHRALVILRERLVSIYMQGEPDITALVLASEDYGDIVASAEYLDAIRDSDADLAERVRTLRDEAKRLVRIRRTAKLTIEKARDAIAAEEQSLEDTRASLEAREGDLLAARGQRQSSLDSVQGEIHQHEEIAADLRSEIAAEIAAATGGQPLPAGPLPTPSAAGLIWPVDGILTSTFGPRWGSMHEGIDVSAAEGTPIMAADAGTVILIQSEYSSGGYGNYTCIDHGGGLSTCYAHQSSFATSLGASVSQGDLIGYVGNTGHSFGAHLHFEVRINGAATDPLGYL